VVPIAARAGLGPDGEPLPAAAAGPEQSEASGPTPSPVPTPPPYRGPATAVAAGADVPLLDVAGLDVSYGSLQVLFDVDLRVDRGEIVALLGTNGAGKSTLLRAIAGLSRCRGGIALDGRGLANRRPERIVRDGVALMPGGKAVFPTLTVAEHLRLACWTFRRDRQRIADSTDDVLELFPALGDRLDACAGDLSGGEQQQLALATTLLLRPEVLLIDELSLGLSPIVVAALCDVVRRLHREGVTIVVVEQSVNVALTLAERAVFMEKGTVRFQGPTRELLDRPDLLRSVFLEGAGGGSGGSERSDGGGPDGVTGVATIDLSSLGGAARRTSGSDTPEPVLRCEGVTKRFGGVEALSHVDLVVAPGEIVGLVGQNGAGKTTLMDCISGFCDLDGGRIVFRGVDVSGWAPFERARSRMGRSFQEARLFPSLTVAETIAVACERTVANRSMVADATRQPASYLAEDETRARVDSLIGLLGLGRYRWTPTSVLSTGTRRIVELGCLLAADPVLMLLDEPSAGVAQRETEALGPLLGRIRDHTGAAMVVIEHDMPLLAGLCDRLVAMELGSVLVDGAPDQVLSHPAVVAAYLGTDAAAIQRSGTVTP
jgi:branched-chain amino acid transport system ATP-binding protein